MFDSYASTITLTAAQDGVCIEDIWIDYALVNDPTDPIFLGNAEDEFLGENVVDTVTFSAPDCRAPVPSLHCCKIYMRLHVRTQLALRDFLTPAFMWGQNLPFRKNSVQNNDEISAKCDRPTVFKIFIAISCF